MKSVRDLHNEAMDRAELAIVAKLRGDSEKTGHLFKEALSLELKAIQILDKTSPSEPTYSVLHRSAATLALDCNDPRLAEQIVAKALSHNPPLEIAEELRDLFEEINFRRHLLRRGIVLDDNEMQMSLAGKVVGFGIVNSEEFLQRIENTSKMIYRIVERRQKKPYRDRGRIRRALKDEYEIFVSVPRAASFSVTLKLGQSSSQRMLPGFLDVSEVIDEFMGLMDLVNRDDIEEIKKRIPEEAYFNNFVGLSKLIAPDGENVKLVGFTTTSKGQDRFVEITRPKEKIATPIGYRPAEIESKMKTVKGHLRFADATSDEKSLIKVVDETTNESHLIKVPEGMMSDIVKPMWGSIVIVTGRQVGRHIHLENIEEV